MRRSIKAEITRDRLVVAAAAILREEGPAAVTYRNVAKWAEASPSATNYYFDSIAELLHEAGARNIRLWAQRAERAAAKAEGLAVGQRREQRVGLILEACLPHDPTKLGNHYAQLLAAAQSTEVSDAYRSGRRRLDSAVERILDSCDCRMRAKTVIALVDGAAVAAISEGRSVLETASALLNEVMETRERLEKGGA